MVFCYLLACVPFLIGAFLWFKTREINWWEWLAGTAIGFAVAGGFHWAAVSGMCRDTETWSGQIQNATYYPYWKQRKTRLVTHKVGKNTYTTTETYYVNHSECWFANCSVNGDVEISQGFYTEICSKFGNKMTVRGNRPNLVDGDPNVYVTQRRTKDVIYPTTCTYNWENRTKAAPSLFSFPKVPQNIKVFDYPKSDNWLISSRLLGSARKVSINQWDKMNSRLGPTKLVNVIMIGFPEDSDSSIADWQEAKWAGGKKNDLVICFGGPTDSPAWARVFGWTEKFEVKKNLESIILDNKIDTSIIPLIENEIRLNYKLKDWSKMDYITVEVPWWSYLVLLLVMGLTQGGFWIWAYKNEMDKDE